MIPYKSHKKFIEKVIKRIDNGPLSDTFNQNEWSGVISICNDLAFSLSTVESNWTKSGIPNNLLIEYRGELVILLDKINDHIDLVKDRDQKDDDKELKSFHRAIIVAIIAASLSGLLSCLGTVIAEHYFGAEKPSIELVYSNDYKSNLCFK